MAIFAVQNYGDRIMQILTTRYNLEFCKLTLYGITLGPNLPEIVQNFSSAGLDSGQPRHCQNIFNTIIRNFYCLDLDL